MRKIVLILAILSLGLFAVIPKAMAWGVIDLYADVQPTFEPGSDTVGTALYRFFVLPTSLYGFNELQLTFEGDIFDLANTATSFTTSPNWDTAVTPDSNGAMKYILTNNSSDEIVPYDLSPLEVSTNFTLLSAERGWEVSGEDWAWNEGQVWAQVVTAVLITELGGFTAAGGTSTTMTPEPATLGLLGFSLLGLAGFRKRFRG